jgi:hypothetical protein
MIEIASIFTTLWGNVGASALASLRHISEYYNLASCCTVLINENVQEKATKQIP